MSEHGTTDVPVIVVTGLPRSGTSMMMRMLQAGGVAVLTDGIRAADADNPYGYYEFEPVKRLKHDQSWVASARGRAVKVVYALLDQLPASTPYKVIFMRRHVQEVVASQDAMLSRRGTPVVPSQSQHVIQLFEEELRKVDRWLAAQRRFHVLHVDYNQAITDPGTACARVNAFLELNLDETRMRSVVTPALYRQRAADRHHLS